MFRAVSTALLFAKFEVDVTVTKSNDPACPLLEHAMDLVSQGNKCLAGKGACQYKMAEVSVWLKDVQASSKALQASGRRRWQNTSKHSWL